MNPKAIAGVFLLVVVGVLGISNASAQSNNYTQTNLVSTVPGLALTRDVDLVHPWGLAVSTGQPFRIAANGKGVFMSYDTGGIPQDQRAVIAVPSGVTVPANPTGVTANTTGAFIPSDSLSSPFLFATRQGTISGEYADDRGDIKTTTILVVDHGSVGAEYTGLAILAPDCCGPYLAAADFHRGFVETFTSFFDPLSTLGDFTDPNLPAGYAPWNLQVVGNRVFVTYALQDAAQHDPVAGPGNGIVDIYDLDGTFAKRFASNGSLNVPSGVVQAGQTFGAFSNDILIGNFGDGLINAFDPSTGQFLGSLKDGNGNPITNPQLHSLIFGNGNGGDADTLYLTAALGDTNGIFASIAVNTSGAGPDFSLATTRSSVTVAPGQPANFSLKASPIANFRGAFTFECDTPPDVSCTLGSPTVDAATGSATVTVAATASSAASANALGAFVLPGLLLTGFGLRRFRRTVSAFVVLTIGLFVLIAGGVTGCGSNGSQMSHQLTTKTFSVKVTAGSVSHNTMLTFNVQ
ncbi:MAG TPA: TIGR03118 family protein [Terracidiphilus sp.]